MKYETPELTALTPAMSAVESSGSKGNEPNQDSFTGEFPEQFAAYADWE
jgi:hypothetical protein